MRKELWNSLHDLFDTDDGSLPDIYILNLSGAGVVNMWAFLSQAATSVGGSCWDRAKQQSIPVESIPNAAELVVGGEAESFHAVCQGIAFKEAIIPGKWNLEIQIHLGPWIIEWVRSGVQRKCKRSLNFSTVCKILREMPW